MNYPPTSTEPDPPTLRDLRAHCRRKKVQFIVWLMPDSGVPEMLETLAALVNEPVAKERVT